MRTEGRVGGYVVFIDNEGRRHALRPHSISCVSETDPLGDEVMLTIGMSRTILVREPLDSVLRLLETVAPGRFGPPPKRPADMAGAD